MQNESQWHKDKGRAKTSLEKYVPLILLQGFEKGYSGFYCERELETEQNCNILTPTLIAVSVVSFLFSSAAQPEARWLTFLLSAGFSATSYHQLVCSPNSIGGREGPFGRVWLSLPPLVSDVSDPQLSDFLSWPSYIIVQRPLNRPLNLWNGMFDRHLAEITVMQFTGHSLPVQQSMSVSWDFLPCTISSAKPAYAISSHNCHWSVSLPSGASLWNGKFGRVECQYITSVFL